MANLSRATKATLIVGGALILLLGPVVLVIVLLAALIAWITTAVRSHQNNKTSTLQTSFQSSV